MSDPLMTQSEYARHRGKSRQYINRMAKAGVLVVRGGRIDVAASDAVLDDRPEPVSERVVAGPPEVAPTGATFAQAKTADMVFKAKLRKMEYDLRMGKLVEAEKVTMRWSTIARLITDRILAWPNRLAPELTPITDERLMRDTMMREVRTLINEIKTDVQYAR